MVRKAVPEMNNPYDIAPSIFFLDRLYRDKDPTAEDLKLINSLGLRLVAGQRRPKHLWRYNVPILDDKAEEKLLKDLNDKTFQGVNSGDLDMSCSQFAALGLWTARKHGVPADFVLDRAYRTASDWQNLDKDHPAYGTWNYSTNPDDGAFKDTSTCCGLILLCVGEGIKNDPQKIIDTIPVKAALKHLGDVIRRNKNPNNLDVSATGGAHGNFYFLWALERTALILGEDKIDGEDWHKWGTDIILAQQDKQNGCWGSHEYQHVPDTCFALLFMLRANLFKDLTRKVTGLAMIEGPRIHLASGPARPPVPVRFRDN